MIDGMRGGGALIADDPIPFYLTKKSGAHRCDVMGNHAHTHGGPGRCLTITAPCTSDLEQTRNHRGHSIVL